MENNLKKAIILCSGGLDSSVTAHYVKKRLNYKKLIILFFNYNQRTLNQERKSSKKIANELNAEFLEIDLRWLGKISNSLINSNKKANKISRKQLKNTQKESETYYVPCRNTMFLIHAITLAEAKFLKEKNKIDIFLGFKCEGRESYPDTTKKFVKEMNKLSKIGCVTKINIRVPLINKDKEEIVKLGQKLGVSLSKTFSCYIGSKNKIANHCGTCLACRLRQEGFYWSGIKDKTNYYSKTL